MFGVHRQFIDAMIVYAMLARAAIAGEPWEVRRTGNSIMMVPTAAQDDMSRQQHSRHDGNQPRHIASPNRRTAFRNTAFRKPTFEKRRLVPRQIYLDRRIL